MKIVHEPAGLAPLLFSGSDQERGDDAHGFLRVVGTVAQAVKSGGNELEMTKGSLGLVALGAMAEPADSRHDGPAQNHADDGRNDQKNDDGNPALDEDR